MIIIFEEVSNGSIDFRGDRVLAVATMGRDPVAAKAANLLFEGKMPSASEIRLVILFV